MSVALRQLRPLAFAASAAVLGSLVFVTSAQATQPKPTLQIGVRDRDLSAAQLRADAPFAWRYHYLAGGVNTPNPWMDWHEGSGSFVSHFVADSASEGMTSVFSYYQIRQSLPGANIGDERQAVLTNLRDRATMRAYFEDFKRVMLMLGPSQSAVIVQVEPDLWGYVQQSASHDDAKEIPAIVAASGLPELRGLPDDARGLAQAFVRLRDRYAPQVRLAYPISIWGTHKDITYSNEPLDTVSHLAARSARFYGSLQADFDLSFAEMADRDAAYAVKRDGKPAEAVWWDAADFERHAHFLDIFHDHVRQPIVIWQIPIGNTISASIDDSPHHYSDNRVQWLLGRNYRAHLRPYLRAGVIALLFGSGQQEGTCACDAAGDGVTNPTPGRRRATSADDDGGYLNSRVRAYYRQGALRLSR